MPLTPSADDPNRKNELARRERDPKSFDQDPIRSAVLPNTNNGGLITENKPRDKQK